MLDLQLDLQDLYIEDLFTSSNKESLDDDDLKSDFDVGGPFSRRIYLSFLTYDDFVYVLSWYACLCSMMIFLPYDFFKGKHLIIASINPKSTILATNLGFSVQKPQNTTIILCSPQIQAAFNVVYGVSVMRIFYSLRSTFFILFQATLIC